MAFERLGRKMDQALARFSQKFHKPEEGNLDPSDLPFSLRLNLSDTEIVSLEVLAVQISEGQKPDQLSPRYFRSLVRQGYAPVGWTTIPVVNILRYTPNQIQHANGPNVHQGEHRRQWIGPKGIEALETTLRNIAAANRAKLR